MTTSTLSKAEYHKAWRDANKEKLIAISKAYHEANREIINARKKAYREANLEKEAVRMKTYREANHEKVALISKIYHEANPSIVILSNLARKYKISRPIARALIPQELLEVKLLELQLHRLINARAEAS